MAQRKKRKIGRNQPCPCGSGVKFKHCHGVNSQPFMAPPGLYTEIQRSLAVHEAREIQRKQQQGLGKPIISALHEGKRLIAVKNKFHLSGRWKTFHDFLFDYIKNILTPDWGNKELAKPHGNRHTILQWYDQVCRYQKSHIKKLGEVHSAPMTGVMAAYLGLAYNLYLLQHNAEIQRRLINRIKNQQQFYPAYYETFVAACMIGAGFELELENEADGSTSHCEFTATCKQSGEKYSVEAKSREAGKKHVIVANQLFKALKKRARYQRIIFIDANVPFDATETEGGSWLEESLKSIRSKEGLLLDGQPAPEAYVFVTNYPCHLHLDSTDFRLQAIVEGFKIPTLGYGTEMTLREALRAREEHADIFALMDSIKMHGCNIPSTFDGEYPEFAYTEETIQRLSIGLSYIVHAGDGHEAIGELTDAIVVEREKAVYGVYKLPDGRSIIVTSPLTGSELSAYRRHPDTFFGVNKPQAKTLQDPIDYFDFVYKTYRHTPKEKILEFMKDSEDIKLLRNESQNELAIIYSERIMHSMLDSRRIPARIPET